jgi:cell division control protein 6
MQTLELTLDADSEPTLSLDFSAKRPRRTPRKISEKEHISVHDKENQENQENEQQPESDSEATPTKSYSRRTSIASTVRSCKPSRNNNLTRAAS